MKHLSPALRHTYDVVKTFVEQNGYAPSFQELASLLNLSSKQTVWQRLSALKRFGYVDYNPSQPRTLRIIACPLDESEVA